ncbi:nickel insertion protein, partial [Streptomyces sp. NPDC058964]|uniref:LarC family nickel insertion protein n=1 Tax=Streptomyces sp. NPDC058964 TaxID=3346681 RepID=UPI0036C3641C
MSAPVSAWFDCSSGVAGDMLLGALLDAGASPGTVQRAVDAVVPGGARIRTERVRRCGLSATKVHVDTDPGPPHRTWQEIRSMLSGAALPGPVRERAHSVFTRLARAEAAVHGIPVDDVHFHEVGALDAIADVVGVCAAVHELAVGTATATPLVLGSGRTSSAHGSIPVPTPAVLRLLADHGAPAESGAFPYEMATPTGVALVLSLCTGWGGMPALRLLGTGAGAGTRDLADVPNVVRLVLGTARQDDTPPGGRAVGVGAGPDHHHPPRGAPPAPTGPPPAGRGPPPPPPPLQTCAGPPPPRPGRPPPDGVFTSGGTQSNLQALLLA